MARFPLGYFIDFFFPARCQANSSFAGSFCKRFGGGLFNVIHDQSLLFSRKYFPLWILIGRDFFQSRFSLFTRHSPECRMFAEKREDWWKIRLIHQLIICFNLLNRKKFHRTEYITQWITQKQLRKLFRNFNWTRRFGFGEWFIIRQLLMRKTFPNRKIKFAVINETLETMFLDIDGVITFHVRIFF